MELCGPAENEASRLWELRSFEVLDTPADPDFDDITELTRRVAGTEIGLISLVDQDRQWFMSCAGAGLGQQQTPRSISFCGHTILQRQPLIVADALADPRFADNPLVLGDPHIRFYAGFPLISPAGFALGSLCAISSQPHSLNPEQVDSLTRLASLTVHHLGRRRQSALLRDTQQTLRSERLRSGSGRDGLRSLDQLISRDQLIQMLDLSLGVESPFALLRCRFRDFDRINATLGSVIAEEFLNEGARRVIAAVPRGSSVARFSESELVVLVPFKGDSADVKRVAERIIGFAGQVYRNGAQALPMDLAIGIALHRGDAESVEALLSDTSMAVRLALRTSTSNIRFIDSDTRVVARESYRLESDLREAISGRLLVPYLQPIIELTTEEPVGFEALARWPQAQGVLAPGSFMPMLNESGITGELDLLIIEKALAAIPLLALPIPQRPMVMSVNLSGILLEEPQLRQQLLALIQDNPLPMGWTLQVELLEDAFQDTSPAFERFLTSLVDRGVAIAIDDFGTGYSSLARLLSLPIQAVKVDRAFIRRLDEPGESPRTLLRTMLSMLKDLGLSITAEGVETSTQQHWLLGQGVSRVQGFLFHQPLPIDGAIELLQQLDYRPAAVPVDPRRLRAVQRRRRRPWRLPFLDRRGPQT